MTREEAREVFLNRGFIDGIYDGDKWREACIVISEWLEQEPKTGHWVKIHPLQADDGGAYMCSCCGTGNWEIKGTENFCPYCGAKMVEPQERSDKE